VSGPSGGPIEMTRAEQAARLRLLSDEDFRTLQAILQCGCPRSLAP
jgi:hypothetical protein